jgi:hypothetical protein
MCIDIADDGTVASVETAGDLAGSEQARCIAAAVRSVRFPSFSRPLSVANPLRFPVALCRMEGLLRWAIASRAAAVAHRDGDRP